MHKLATAVLFVSIAASSVNAQGLGRAPAKPADPAPASETARKPSVLEKIFGPREKPAPAAAPATPTPAPVVKRRAVVKPRRAVVVKPEPGGKPAATAAASKPATSKKNSAPQKIDLTGLDDATKFKLVRAKAVEDPQLKELRAKADSELDDAEAQKAGTDYNRALFRKIREIEPSLDGYVDKVEGAMSKRLASEKGKQ